MRLRSIKTCVDPRGDVSGLQFVLGVPGKPDQFLYPAGDVTVGCTTTQLLATVRTIKASSNSRDNGVNNLLIKAGDQKIKTSKIAKDFKQWFFTEDKPLIGIYGRQNDKIDQLGFITLDVACQAAYEE